MYFWTSIQLVCKLILLRFNRLNRMMPPQSRIEISMTYSVFMAELMAFTCNSLRLNNPLDYGVKATRLTQLPASR